jgi:signal transduction histidine kinase
MRPATFARRSPRRLYVALLATLLVSLVGLLLTTFVWSYRHVRGQVERELEDRLLSLGHVVSEGQRAAPMDAGSHEDSVAAFARLGAELRRIAAQNDLGSIEVIDTRRRRLAATDDAVAFGERNPLMSAQPEVAAALAGIPAATPLVQVEGLPGTYFKTGFVPIEDPEGRILGVVALQGGSGFFQILPSLRSTWVLAGGAFVLLAVVLAILLVGVFRALERTERSLRGAAALATAGQLAAVVAHEIRNPLAALQSRSERVQEELAAGADPQSVSKLLEAIPNEVRRLDRILRNYLSLARATEGPGRCAVGSVVQETIELFEKDLSRAGIAILWQPPQPELRARIDAGSLRQALLNLLLNAREAMSDGGEITVAAREEEGKVRLTVTDTGHGMDRATRKRLFEPFYTTRPSGSGLGLAVVDSVVRSCGGSVEVQSTPAKGSTFVLLLPLEAGKGEP